MKPGEALRLVQASLRELEDAHEYLDRCAIPHGALRRRIEALCEAVRVEEARRHGAR